MQRAHEAGAIGIVGAGIAGLASAVLLARAGYKVTLFERFETPRPIGAGLLLQPTGQAVLRQLGVADRIESLAAPIHRLDGRSIAGRTVFDLAYATGNSEWRGLGVHRGVLFGALFDALSGAGVTVNAGLDVAAFDAAGAGAFVIDGASRRHGPFSLIVVADGAHSTLRERLWGPRVARIYPWGCVWAILPDPAGAFDGALTQRFGGARRMAGVLPVGRPHDGAGTSVALFWSLRVDAMAEWREAGLPAFKSELHRMWPEAAALLRDADDLAPFIAARYCDVSMGLRRHGRVLFIGDAAHGTSPQLGQGANLALLDAAVLGDTLRDGISDAALDAFIDRRRANVRFYRWASLLLTPFFQSESRILPWLRDLAFAPICRFPPSGREMVKILAGVKTGLTGRL